MDALSIIGSFTSINGSGGVPKFTTYDIPIGENSNLKPLSCSLHPVYILQHKNNTDTFYRIISSGAALSIGYAEVVSSDSESATTIGDIWVKLEGTTISGCISGSSYGNWVVPAGLIGVG